MTNMKISTSCFAVVVSLLLLQLVHANEQDDTPKYALKLSQGITHSEFHWSINGNPSPNILSELHWRDLEIDQTQLRFDLKQQNFRYRFEVGYGSISSGKNQDSDFLNNNRQNEFSRSYSDVSGETIDFGFTLGYDLILSKPNRLIFTPMIGLSSFEQRLGMHNGTKVIDYNGINISPTNEPLIGLDSSYDTDWDTRWFGGEIHWQVISKLRLNLNYQYHYDIDYFATANWNLRTNFQHPVSFIHKAERGEGHLASLSASYQIHPQLQLSAHYSYLKLKATEGLDITYFSNNTAGATGLNIAEVKSNSLLLGIIWIP